MASAGDATAALCIGGYSTAVLAQTEIWDGTSWTETTDLSTGRYFIVGAGTTSAGLGMGGETSTAASNKYRRMERKCSDRCLGNSSKYE